VKGNGGTKTEKLSAETVSMLVLSRSFGAVLARDA
jgi:hypothetical protein